MMLRRRLLCCKFCLEIGYKLQGVKRNSMWLGRRRRSRGVPPPGLSSHNAQEQNNLLNYPSQSLAGLSMRLVTTFNFTYWLLCVFWLSPSSHYSLQAARTSCDASPAAEAGSVADSKPFLFLASSFYRCLPLILKSAHSLECSLFVRRRSLGGGVGGPGAASGHGVDGGACVLGHVIIGASADNICGRLPDENGALGTGSHDELLVGRDGDL